MISKPLLSPNDDPLKNLDFFNNLQFPYLVSPKLDGIRGISTGSAVLSRTMKVLPSAQVQQRFGIPEFKGLDGELVEGSLVGDGVYNRTASYVMSDNKPGDVSFYCFDCVNEDIIEKPFYERLEYVSSIFADDVFPYATSVAHEVAENLKELLEIESRYLEIGYEGVMLRNPLGIYKQGRATYNQNIIYKLKRFQDDESVIIGFYEAMTNNNEKETDERGYAKRSTSMAGLVGAGTLGGFYALYHGMELRVPCGSFNHAQRKEIWDDQDKYLGMTLKFRFMQYGAKDKPRFMRALGFRNQMDLF